MKKTHNFERTIVDSDRNKLILCGIIKSNKELTVHDMIKFINIHNKLEKQNTNDKTQMYIIKRSIL